MNAAMADESRDARYETRSVRNEDRSGRCEAIGDQCEGRSTYKCDAYQAECDTYQDAVQQLNFLLSIRATAGDMGPVVADMLSAWARRSKIVLEAHEGPNCVECCRRLREVIFCHRIVAGDLPTSLQTGQKEEKRVPICWPIEVAMWLHCF
jgi:hypothetical protein